MESKKQHGYLVLADISGFTSFMAASELEHAHDILSELLELLVNRLTPLFNLVEVEGDAVYVCAPESSIPRGEMLLEVFESTYAAFKDRVEAVHRQTTCTCNACRLIPSLDLKFITSCGDYILQNIAGNQKPVGSAVNLVHRLSKNHVTDATGWRAYVLFTAGTLQHMGLEPNGMRAQVETYEHLGDIETYAFDLLSRYRARVAARRVFVSSAEADASMTIEIAAPPSLVWEWLNDAAKRTQWGGLEIHADKADGRRGMGTTNHCIHGKNSERLQTIVDWRPFDYFTYEDRTSTSDKPEMLMTHQLEPTPNGTRLYVRMKLLGPMPGVVKKTMCAMIVRMYHIEQNYKRLASMLTEEMAKTVEPVMA